MYEVTKFDLPGNVHLQTILRDFAEQKKVIAALCHGPAGLVDVLLKDGTALVAGKTLTSFTNEEEAAAGMTEQMPFLLEDRLKVLGANFVIKPNWSDHVQVDGTLITGQNPQSSKRIALAIINVLFEKKGE
jgi:putative intracellular protease/amidase